MFSILVKCVIFSIITFFITAILATFQLKFKISFEKIVLPQLAPALAAFLIVFFWKEYHFHFGKINLDLKFLQGILIAFSIPILLFSIVVCFKYDSFQDLESRFLDYIPNILLGSLLGAFAEEIGWRSFLLPQLTLKTSYLIATIIVGLIWGLWHIGHYKNGFLFMVGFVIFTISASIVLSLILKNQHNILIISGVFHFSINFCFYMFFKDNNTETSKLIIISFVWFIPALMIILLGMLSKN